MRRLALVLLPAAVATCGCDGGAPGKATPGTSQVADTAAAPSASVTVAPGAGRPLPTREGSAVARAPADDALYVADEDHGVVRRVPLPFDPAAAVITVAMPGLPAQVLPLGDRVLVTVRSEGGLPATAPPAGDGGGAPDPKARRLPEAPTGPGLLLIMRPDPAAGLVEVARVALPADAWGVAVTPDERTALVSSAWTHQVSAIDLATAKKTWSLDVPREPRAIVVRPDGASAYVTHLVSGAITRVDDLLGQPKAHPVTLPPSPLRSPSGKTLDGTLAYSAALSPDGSRFFVARHAIGALGEAAWFGAATVDVLLTADDTPFAPKRDVGLPKVGAEIVALLRAQSTESLDTFPRINQAPFVEPRAMVYRKRTSTLLVASEGTNVVVEMDARTVDPTMFVVRAHALGGDRDRLIPVSRSGGAPSGIALSADESTAWVYCRSTDDVVQVLLDPLPKEKDKEKGKGRDASQTLLHLADDLLGEPDGKGRRIFYDATDEITSGGVSCAGCHPDGRDDGHVWHEAKFATKRRGEGTNFLGDADQAPLEHTIKVGYARQTPMLAGRLSASGPYGWHGESRDLVARLKAGFTLHRWGEIQSNVYGDGELLGRAQYLAPFLRHGLVPPPRDVHPITPEEARGKEIFAGARAGCARCHVPDTEYTDRTAYAFSPKPPPPAGFEDEKRSEYKTPSLFFVAGTPPYFHDGRAPTLEALVDQNQDRMGHTSHLSPDERASLIAFLRTL
jgi:DNA-binding beta-propeller fold protein YncE/mono/diheme cytochrome c family protein